MDDLAPGFAEVIGNHRYSRILVYETAAQSFQHERMNLRE